MKTIQVTATKLDGSVSFEVHQNDECLVKDTFHGKTSTQFIRKYPVNCTSDKISITTTHIDSEDVGISVKVIS